MAAEDRKQRFAQLFNANLDSEGAVQMNAGASIEPHGFGNERYKRQLLEAHKRAGRHVTPENALLYIKLSEDVLRLLHQADNPVVYLLPKNEQSGGKNPIDNLDNFS